MNNTMNYVIAKRNVNTTLGELLKHVSEDTRILVKDLEENEVFEFYSKDAMHDGWMALDVDDYYFGFCLGRAQVIVETYYIHRCSDCGKVIFEGYVVDGGFSYYCEGCLPKHFTEDEWYAACDESDENYWTDWY